MIELLTSEVGLGFVFTILGILIKMYCPAWVPLLGVSEKLIKELVDLLDKTGEDNKSIKNRALLEEKKKASKLLMKKLPDF